MSSQSRRERKQARSAQGLTLVRRKLRWHAVLELMLALWVLTVAGPLLALALLSRRHTSWEWDDGVWLLILLAAVGQGLRMLLRIRSHWPVERSRLYRALTGEGGVATAVVHSSRGWRYLAVEFEDGETLRLHLGLRGGRELLDVIAERCPGTRVD